METTSTPLSHRNTKYSLTSKITSARRLFDAYTFKEVISNSSNCVQDILFYLVDGTAIRYSTDNVLRKRFE